MATISSPLQTIRSKLAQVCQAIFSASSINRPFLSVEIPTSHHVPVFRLPSPQRSPFVDVEAPPVYTPYYRPYYPQSSAEVRAPVYFSTRPVPRPSPVVVKTALSPEPAVDQAPSPVVEVDQAPPNWKPVFKHSPVSSAVSHDSNEDRFKDEPMTPPTPYTPIVIAFKTRFSAEDAEIYFRYFRYFPEVAEAEDTFSPLPDTPVVVKKARTVKPKQPRDRRPVKKSFKKERRHYTKRVELIDLTNDTATIKVFPPEYVHRSDDDVRISVSL
jgi:hypothetical protein